MKKDKTKARLAREGLYDKWSIQAPAEQRVALGLTCTRYAIITIPQASEWRSES